VPGVKRSRLTLLLPLAALLVAGCTSFSDNDAVARFDHVELGADELTELMAVLSPPNVESDPTDAVVARDTISTWLRIEAAKQRLDDDGVVVSDSQLAEATTQMSSFLLDFDLLPDRMRNYLVDAQAAFLALADVAPPTAEELRDVYERGPAGGVTCVAHILVATEDEANEVAAELDAGTDFATLAAERSLDQGSGPQGGVLPCSASDEFATTYVTPFADAALAAEIGVPTAPVESTFGFHVILLRPFDEAQADITAFFQPQEFAITRTIEQADVYVDPRYGTIDGNRVVPLA